MNGKRIDSDPAKRYDYYTAMQAVYALRIGEGKGEHAWTYEAVLVDSPTVTGRCYEVWAHDPDGFFAGKY